MKTSELTAEIEERSGVEISTVPRTAAFVWFNDPKGRPTMFYRDQENPLKDGSIVYEIFQNDEVARVYTIGVEADKPSPPQRYTLTKTAPTFAVEVMGLDVFMDEIASEWQDVAGIDDEDLPDDDDEDGMLVDDVASTTAKVATSTAEVAPRSATLVEKPQLDGHNI